MHLLQEYHYVSYKYFYTSHWSLSTEQWKAQMTIWRATLRNQARHFLHKKKLKKHHQNETWQWTPLFVLFNISKCTLSSFESTIFIHSINLPCSFTVTYHCQHCSHICYVEAVNIPYWVSMFLYALVCVCKPVSVVLFAQNHIIGSDNQ